MSTLLRALTRLPAVTWLAVWTLGAVVQASWLVARDIVAPSARLAPAVITLPLRCTNRWELSVLAGLITITPGTLVVGIEPDLGRIWVHGMYGSDPDRLRAEVSDLQDRVIRALRIDTVRSGGST
ncbi:MAG: Na+/H+ antiporter subunit E [Actinobacteria bacterium]|nr:Na+/H+ antiporter subunit E [Actinomycetota bacterium]MCB9411747.1 Na+/H+ antiporter subunit E [Actinomycetota bacterium]